MLDYEKSAVFWNEGGYLEMVFVGVQTPEEIQVLDRQARGILAEQETPSNLLIDARRGRIGRDAASFSTLMRLGRERHLKQLVVLVDEKPAHPDAGRETGVIVSMLTAALGKRPIYIYDEAAARALVGSG